MKFKFDKQLIVNISSMLGVQGLNYIIPLITLPYMVRILEPKGYGTYVFILAIIQYFNMYVDYGFNLTATKKISENRNCVVTVSKIFWNVIFSKLLLFFTGLVVILFISYIPQFKMYERYLLIGSIMVVGGLINPFWLFQGKEKMGWFALCTTISKCLCIPLIFLYIKKSSDVDLALVIMGLTSLFTGLLSWFFIIKNKWIKWVKPDLSFSMNLIKDGWNVFVLTTSASLYTTGTIVLLGFLTNPLVVGVYVSADKLRQVIQSAINPICQSLFPRVNFLMSNDKEQAFLFMRKSIKYQLFGYLIISIPLYYFSSDIINIVYGSNYQSSAFIFKVMVFVLIVSGVNNALGVQTLLVLNYGKIFSKVVFIAGLCNIISIYVSADLYQEKGAVFSYLFAEMVVCISLFCIIISKKIPVFKFFSINEYTK